MREEEELFCCFNDLIEQIGGGGTVLLLNDLIEQTSVTYRT